MQFTSNFPTFDSSKSDQSLTAYFQLRLRPYTFEQSAVATASLSDNGTHKFNFVLNPFHLMKAH